MNKAEESVSVKKIVIFRVFKGVDPAGIGHIKGLRWVGLLCFMGY
jgi:hypothetical protein